MKLYHYIAIAICCSQFYGCAKAFTSSSSSSSGMGTPGQPLTLSLHDIIKKFISYAYNAAPIFETTVSNLQNILTNAQSSSDLQVINSVWANIILQYPALYNVFSQQTQSLVNNLKNPLLYMPPTLAFEKLDWNNFVNQFQSIASLSGETSSKFSVYQSMLAGYTTNGNFKFPNHNLNFPMIMAKELNATNMDVVAENQELAILFQQFSSLIANQFAAQISPTSTRFIHHLGELMTKIPNDLLMIASIWAKASENFGAESNSVSSKVFSIPMSSMAAIIRQTTINLLPYYADIGNSLENFVHQISR